MNDELSPRAVIMTSMIGASIMIARLWTGSWITVFYGIGTLFQLPKGLLGKVQREK